jgi:CheY-like chemotaxis protein
LLIRTVLAFGLRDSNDPEGRPASEGWISALLFVGAGGAIVQTLSFALAIADGSAGAGLLALVGSGLSGFTLLGLVLWTAQRARARRTTPELSRPSEALVTTPISDTTPPGADTEPPAAETPELEADTERPAPATKESGRGAALEEIAHDINDLMTVVITQAEFLRERHAGRRSAELEPILDAANRLSGVARRLVAFAERQRLEAPPTLRGALSGPGIVRAPRDLGRDTLPSILDAVEGVRDADSVVRESHPAHSGRRVADSPKLILLVEDELVLLRATRRMLEQRGYQVLAASTGSEALDLALEAPGIDVLITDLSLPGMDGMELARQLCWSQPGLKVLYTSGYDTATTGLALEAGGREAFLPKPFTARELTDRLTELCGSAERGALAQPG